MVTEHSNTIAFPNRAGEARQGLGSNTQDPRLQLSTLLQTTLDLEQLLELFQGALQEQLGISGLNYQFRDKDQSASLNLGQTATHACHYHLVIAERSLGELTLSRGRRLLERELVSLETLIGCLILPLRNALQFRQVLAQSMRDPLTGIANRGAFDASLERELALFQRCGQTLSLMAIDIDLFKRINDSHGHAAGDFVLTNVVQNLRDCCRESDGLFRYGGDELVVILSHTSLAGASVIARRILNQVASMTTIYQGQAIDTTVSIGLAQVSAGDTADTLFQRADAALYQAKREGRNRLICADVTHVA
ncbi:MAG: GGDEF domain-containing protein [Spongiibacteraceae bacterium]|jgi:diguanylate cyclase (GGDEF)-like protein|nr:GGDEF domain-containing protein [Spongiibacteraceae bacterium]